MFNFVTKLLNRTPAAPTVTAKEQREQENRRLGIMTDPRDRYYRPNQVEALPEVKLCNMLAVFSMDLESRKAKGLQIDPASLISDYSELRKVAREVLLDNDGGLIIPRVAYLEMRGYHVSLVKSSGLLILTTPSGVLTLHTRDGDAKTSCDAIRY